MLRYELLTQLHLLLRPKVYLEIGVQTGASIDLAHAADVAIGIDPYPLVGQARNQLIFSETSNDFFHSLPFRSDLSLRGMGGIDFAYIDGSHLSEDAFSDFCHVCEYINAGGVIAFDDVMPYSEAIAARDQPPGDWTGDVWKVTHALLKHRSNLFIREVDVSPTGLLLVWGFGTGPVLFSDEEEAEIRRSFMSPHMVPQATLDRTYAVQPEAVLEELRAWRESL